MWCKCNGCGAAVSEVRQNDPTEFGQGMVRADASARGGRWRSEADRVSRLYCPACQATRDGGAMQTTHSATRFHTLAMKTATKTVKLPHLPARKEAWPWSDDVVADRADAEIARLRVSKKPDPFAASNARKPREQK